MRLLHLTPSHRIAPGCLEVNSGVGLRPMGKRDWRGPVCAVAVPAVLVGCARSSVEAANLTPCEKEFRAKKAKYLSHRAIATTQGRPLGAPNIACGFSVQWGTKSDAVSAALR